MATHQQQLAAFVKAVLGQGISKALVLGMGGSSLAPELFGRIFAQELGDQQALQEAGRGFFGFTSRRKSRKASGISQTCFAFGADRSWRAGIQPQCRVAKQQEGLPHIRSPLRIVGNLAAGSHMNFTDGQIGFFYKQSCQR